MRKQYTYCASQLFNTTVLDVADVLLAHHLHQHVVLKPAMPGDDANPLSRLSADLAGRNAIHHLDILTEGGLKVASGKVLSLPAVWEHLFTYGTIRMRLVDVMLEVTLGCEALPTLAAQIIRLFF